MKKKDPLQSHSPHPPSRKPPGRRRQARELALQLLYAMEITSYDMESTLEDYNRMQRRERNKPGENREEMKISPVPMNDFTKNLLTTVQGHQKELDELLRAVITNWKLERLSHIDRNILRLAGAEICFFQDIPPKVTINEYIEIAKDFSDQDSPSFINGILDRIAKESGKGM